jgi:CAAX protease family protein
MTSDLRRPIAGTLVAIAVTSTMDATGLTNFSALALAPLLALFWYSARMSRREVGFTWGAAADYARAALYPLAVMSGVTLIAFAAGAIDVSHTTWWKAGANFALLALSTVLVAVITEEGFFRGWLWASLARAGLSPAKVLLWSSVAFAAWHISVVALPTGFDLPARQIPVFLVNAAVMGVVWGLLRATSGSVIVSSVSHGIWNGFAYVLFAYGTRVGALGVVRTAIFGPEVGWVGLAVNAAFAFALWRWWRARPAPGGPADPSETRP